MKITVYTLHHSTTHSNSQNGNVTTSETRSHYIQESPTYYPYICHVVESEDFTIETEHIRMKHTQVNATVMVTPTTLNWYDHYTRP